MPLGQPNDGALDAGRGRRATAPSRHIRIWSLVVVMIIIIIIVARNHLRQEKRRGKEDAGSL